jgi:hypothetical protein
MVVTVLRLVLARMSVREVSNQAVGGKVQIRKTLQKFGVEQETNVWNMAGDPEREYSVVFAIVDGRHVAT